MTEKVEEDLPPWMTEKAMIVDHGSHTHKTGWGNDDRPLGEFPAITAQTARPTIMVGMGQKTFFIGDEAISKRGILRGMQYTVQHGLVTNWDRWEHLMHHSLYNELRHAPDDHPVVMTQQTYAPRAHREKQLQIVMETFNAMAFALVDAPACALLASGRTSGLVLDIGESSSRVTPVLHGCAVSAGSQRVNLGGQQVTEYLLGLLFEEFTDPLASLPFGLTERLECEVIKRTHAFVASDFAAEDAASAGGGESKHSIKYDLPDGQVLEIAGRHRFRCAERLFQPSLDVFQGKWHESHGGRSLPQAVLDAVRATDHRCVTDKVLLTGGGSLLAGLPERLAGELKADLRKDEAVAAAADSKASSGDSKSSGGGDGDAGSKKQSLTLLVPPAQDRRLATWRGAAMLSQLSTFRQALLLKADYDEYGPMLARIRFGF